VSTLFRLGWRIAVFNGSGSRWPPGKRHVVIAQVAVSAGRGGKPARDVGPGVPHRSRWQSIPVVGGHDARMHRSGSCGPERSQVHRTDPIPNLLGVLGAPMRVSDRGRGYECTASIGIRKQLGTFGAVSLRCRVADKVVVERRNNEKPSAHTQRGMQCK